MCPLRYPTGPSYTFIMCCSLLYPKCYKQQPFNSVCARNTFFYCYSIWFITIFQLYRMRHDCGESKIYVVHNLYESLHYTRLVDYIIHSIHAYFAINSQTTRQNIKYSNKILIEILTIWLRNRMFFIHVQCADWKYFIASGCYRKRTRNAYGVNWYHNQSAHFSTLSGEVLYYYFFKTTMIESNRTKRQKVEQNDNKCFVE